jgi:hypothetical protein
VFGHRHSLAIKARLLFEPRISVTAVNVLRRSRRTALKRPPTSRVEQIVLASDLTRPIREALAYATHLGPPTTAVHIDVDSDQRRRLEGEWATIGDGVVLEVIESPYRGIVDPLVAYVHERRRLALPGTLISVIIPEFVVPGRITQALHNQTGLAIKASLAREPGIAVTSVPYHLVSNHRPAIGSPNPANDAGPIEA